MVGVLARFSMSLLISLLATIEIFLALCAQIHKALTLSVHVYSSGFCPILEICVSGVAIAPSVHPGGALSLRQLLITFHHHVLLFSHILKLFSEGTQQSTAVIMKDFSGLDTSAGSCSRF